MYENTKQYIYVRTSFGLDSKTGLDSGPTSPNNRFVERGRKSQPKFRKKGNSCECLGRIVIQARYKNHHRLSQNNMIKSMEFFLLLLYFLNFLFLCFFSPPFFGHIFMLYTMIFVPFSPYTCKLGFESFSLSHLTPP